MPLRRNALSGVIKFAFEFVGKGSHQAGLPKWVLIKHGPADDVPQIGFGVPAEIIKKSDFSGKLQELLLNDVARADISCGHDGCPKCP